MNSINFIAKQIKANIPHIKCDSICAFTGQKITEGIKKKDALSANFTDIEYLKYDSEFISVDAYKCITGVIEVHKNNKIIFNSLRNYSYFVDENKLKLLKKEDLWDIIINTPDAPFVLAYTFNSKKHTTIKSKITYDKDLIYVATDTLGNIILDRKTIEILCPIIQNWYSAIPEMKEPQTLFIKDEILFGTDNVKKIYEYGYEKFKQENEILAKYRNTNVIVLLTRLVNRCVLK